MFILETDQQNYNFIDNYIILNLSCPKYELYNSGVLCHLNRMYITNVHFLMVNCNYGGFSLTKNERIKAELDLKKKRGGGGVKKKTS